MFDIEKKPKFLFIDIDGNPTPVYLDELPTDIVEQAIKNKNIGNDVEHRFVIPYAVKKLLNNRTLRKACHNKSYLEIMLEVLNEDYVVLIDTTNYNNYHIGRQHDGALWHKANISPNQVEYLSEINDTLNSYGFLRCEEQTADGKFISTSYSDFCKEYGIDENKKRI